MGQAACMIEKMPCDEKPYSLFLKDGRSMESNQPLKLFISQEIKAKLESLRLKEEDIQKTIRHAEQTGQKFEHLKTGHFLTGLRPYFITVWVEYTPRDGGYEVHSVYHHRVKVTGIEST